GVAAPTASITSPAAPLVVAENATISLAGTGSDPNSSGVISTYAWHVTKDGNSFADLTGTSATLHVGTFGTYVIHFTVTDQYATSADVTRSVQVVVQPTAQITLLSPASGNVFAGDSVTVDGGSSLHQAGHSLGYTWTITNGGASVPFTTSGSSASFTAASGTQSYLVKLDVDDQGVHSATQATRTVTSSPAPLPVAHIANSGTVLVNVPVTLDSTGSASGDGGGFSCSWTVALHGGAAQTVTNAATCGTATFTPTVGGDYDVTLTVTDGHGSKQATATITASNVQVSIDAGAHQTAVLGGTVALTGSAAAIAGDSFTYAWTITSKPAGSTSAITNATSNTTAGLVVDAQGDFVVRLTATATDPQHPSGFAETTITVSPPLTSSTASLGFDAAIGSSVTASAVVTNNNAAPLTLQSVTLDGPAVADFALDAGNGCTPGLAVPHASPCTLVVRFTPSVAATRNANVTLAYAANGSPLVVALVGRGSPRPQGVLSSTNWNPAFDDTVLGSTNQKSVTLSNTSSGASAAPLTLASLAVTGAAAGDYQLGGDCAAATVLAPGASCTLAITFAPTATGARAAAVQIGLTNATNASATIALTGNGLPVPVPVVGFAPVPLNFGTQTVGGAYPAQTATVTNTGQAPLVIAGVTASGSGFAVKDASSCAGATLAAGARCHVDVSFTPSAVQDFDGTLAVASNAPGSPATLALHGTGTAAQAPVLAWSPAVTTLDFGTVQAGVVSATQSLTLTNQGPGGATLSFVNAVGAGSSAFSIRYDTCTALQPMFAGQSCRIDVQFVPAAAGARSATLQVVSNGSAPVPVTLSGTGSGGPALALALSTTAMDFGSVQMGTRSQPATLRLSNSGSGTVQVSAIQASGAFSVQGATCPATPFALQPGAECTVAVMFQPASSGAAAGTLTVQSDAQAQAGDVALTGHADQAPDLSSGGCSISRGDGVFDPTLWALGVLALAALALRARARRRDARGGRESAR
ncbi:MAG TPA: choice-of-anchor D domain-containing protein, partial [Burkholderiaceae bacterium]